MVDSHTEIDHATTATLAAQSLANSVAIAVSDATTALRNVQAIMTTVQSVAMARWLASGERDDSFQQIASTATQITRDAVRLWQEVQATAQTVLAGDGASSTTASASEESRETTNTSRVAKPPARKSTKKAARKPTKPVAAKRAGKSVAAKKPVKAKPAAKKAGKKAAAAKPARKPRKPRAKPAPAAAPPSDVFPTQET
jgi:hypothetical protein